MGVNFLRHIEMFPVGAVGGAGAGGGSQKGKAKKALALSIENCSALA